MIINKHSSFYIRNGWPTKILTEVRTDAHIFSPNQAAELRAVDEFGLGRVMIKALRYWAKALGLISEGNDAQGLMAQETDLFRLLYDNDLYCQNKATIYLLHRELAKNDDVATAWYWAFNELSKITVTKDDFLSGFFAFLTVNGQNYNAKAIEKEFNCFKSTYVTDTAFSIDKIIEDNISPFFGPIEMLQKVGKDKYQKRKISSKDIPSDVILYCILKDNEEQLNNNRQLSIDLLLDEKKQIGKYFNITYGVLIEMLQELENLDKIKIFNNYGNRHIEIYNNGATRLIQDYYRKARS
jgi:hydrogenase maturation factor